MKTIIGAILGLSAMIPTLAFACFGRAGDGYGMMGYGAGIGGFGFFIVVGGLVWTVVGILAAVWLWQQVNKK